MDADTKLAMLVSVSGCSSPSTLFAVSITDTSSSSASFHPPSLLYVHARLAMLLSVLDDLRQAAMKGGLLWTSACKFRKFTILALRDSIDMYSGTGTTDTAIRSCLKLSAWAFAFHIVNQLVPRTADDNHLANQQIVQVCMAFFQACSKCAMGNAAVTNLALLKCP